MNKSIHSFEPFSTTIRTTIRNVPELLHIAAGRFCAPSCCAQLYHISTKAFNRIEHYFWKIFDVAILRHLRPTFATKKPAGRNASLPRAWYFGTLVLIVVFRTKGLTLSFDFDRIKAQKNKEETVLSITATELKNNLGKYLLLSATEDVYITRNGKAVSKLTNPFQERVDIAKSLFGVLPDVVTLEQAKEERLARI